MKSIIQTFIFVYVTWKQKIIRIQNGIDNNTLFEDKSIRYKASPTYCSSNYGHK